MTKVKIDLTGRRFGRLTVLRCGEKKLRGRNLWTCKCDCGNTCYVEGYQLRKGDTVSCGCKRKTHHVLMHKALTTHGMTHTRLYKIWNGMVQRGNPHSIDKTKRRYRELGITVCSEWRSDFTAFRDWAMENGYRDDLTIDRIDTFGNYEPKNCRWATRTEQQNNTRSNVTYTANGETHTVTEWSRITGVPAQRIAYRIRHGWPTELVFDKENHQRNPTRKWWENE